MHILYHMLLSSSYESEMFRTKVVEKIKTTFSAQ